MDNFSILITIIFVHIEKLAHVSKFYGQPRLIRMIRIV